MINFNENVDCIFLNNDHTYEDLFVAFFKFFFQLISFLQLGE